MNLKIIVISVFCKKLHFVIQKIYIYNEMLIIFGIIQVQLPGHKIHVLMHQGLVTRTDTCIGASRASKLICTWTCIYSKYLADCSVPFMIYKTLGLFYKGSKQVMNFIKLRKIIHNCEETNNNFYIWYYINHIQFLNHWYLGNFSTQLGWEKFLCVKKKIALAFLKTFHKKTIS